MGVGDDLLLKVLHDLCPPVPLVLVAAHYRLEQPFAAELAHVHPEVHGLVELLELACAQLYG